ncbi:MAG: restriction endonuclease subunit R [Bacilli bacterium]|nr:restriction endonuclease subunit R [Bacilli bacterium]
MSFKNNLMAIDPSKKCLEFLADRILDPGYRGMQISQHNRYDVDVIITLLEQMYLLIGKNRMTIRNTDLKKRPANTPDEYLYAEYTNKVNAILKRCTQDSIRKNLFVDLHRMGLIKRYDKNGFLTNPYEKTGIRYVSLTDTAVSLIENKNNTFNKNLIYTKAIDILTHGLANDLLDIVMSNDKNSINIHEFMFFISYMGKTLNNHYFTRTDVMELMNEYRSMSKIQQQAVVDVVSNYCNPKSFSGDKTYKRDYGNWKNEAQQIFMLMNQTVLFETGTGKESNTLYIKVGNGALFADSTKLARSKKAKDDYFVNHNVDKKLGFELHHVIPLLIARSREEFDALDVWQNMVYIDGYTHGIISQTNNKNIEMEFDGDNICLKDIANIQKEIVCQKDINVEYSVLKKDTMLNYNKNTINSL